MADATIGDARGKAVLPCDGFLWHLCEMTDNELRKSLEILRIEHRDLDIAIAALGEVRPVDQLQIARFKKRKLRLRDQISYIEDQLIPDIIA